MGRNASQKIKAIIDKFILIINEVYKLLLKLLQLIGCLLLVIHKTTLVSLSVQYIVQQQMHVQTMPSETGNYKNPKVNSFIHTLPKANQIFEILQHVKKSIYPFEMITNIHKQMRKDQQPYVKENERTGSGEKFKPNLQTVNAYFQKSHLIYDKFNNNCDQELFNQNIYSIEKLKNLKNIDYVTHVQYTKCFENTDSDFLRFSSRFESGNLSMASFVQGIYYLLLHNDVNTSGYTSWFYFRVRAPLKGRYKFAILNYGKAGVMHNQGVRICVYDQKLGWIRGCENISCEFNRNLFRKGPYLNFNTLYFQYQFEQDNSQVYFSYNVPYTYNDLCCFLDKIEEDSLPFFNRKLAGISLAGNRLEMLTIANFSLLNSGYDLPVIVMMARSHPGQTVSSWIMHQFIKFIISNDPEAVTLRNNFIFKLFPMMNPDGVIHGNYRCSLSGRDLNRRWDQTNKQLFPQVYFVRNQIIEVSKRKTIKMVIDLHGHTKKKKIFAYGCNNRNQPHRCRLFPYILSKLTNYFQFKFCNFCMSRYKYGTARISLYNQLKIPYIYTIQTSQFGTNEGHLSLKVFNQIAVSLAKSFFSLFRIRKNDKENDKNGDIFQKIQNQLINDVNLLRIGADKDSGSESEPSVDNIKFDRLAQLTKRRQLKIQSVKVEAKHQRLKSNANPSLSLQKIQKSAPVRPKTSEPHAKRYEEQKIVRPIHIHKRSSVMSKIATQRMKANSKSQAGCYVAKSVPTKRKAEALNFINLSLSIFDEEKSKKNYRTGPNIQDNYSNFNEALFHKLKMAPRNYFQFRKIK